MTKCVVLGELRYKRHFVVLAIAHVGLAVSPLVDVGYTKYQGVALQNGITQWLGVRYAAPPLGALRFREPADPLKNTTVQQANAHGPICLATGAAFPTAGQSEDCLFLDVYAPSKATSTSKLPVFFFIQGGGFIQDSNPNYNGTGLIQAGDMQIVVVNFNYRVGPFGFLSSKEVVAGGSLNNGLKDQRKAMEWVQQHISKFGGNPNHVVLGGDSAGAISITHHLTAFGGKPTTLFQGAMGESQGCPTEFFPNQTQFLYDNFVTTTGCANASDTLACLRTTDISILQRANKNIPYPGRPSAPLFSFSPAIDGDLIPDFSYRLFRTGRFIRVPVVFGDDTNEGTVFTPTTLNSTTDMNTFLVNQFPLLTNDMVAGIDALYPQAEPVSGHGAFFSAASAAYGDMRYVCAGINISASIASFKNSKSNYLYHYNVMDPGQVAQGNGVPHTTEIHAIWGPANTNGGAPASYFPGQINAAIVPVMQGYWTSFIRTLDPNVHRAAGSPEWVPFKEGGRRILFQTNATAMESITDEQMTKCDFFTGIGLEIQQ